MHSSPPTCLDIWLWSSPDFYATAVTATHGCQLSPHHTLIQQSAAYGFLMVDLQCSKLQHISGKHKAAPFTANRNGIASRRRHVTRNCILPSQQLWDALLPKNTHKVASSDLLTAEDCAHVHQQQGHEGKAGLFSRRDTLLLPALGGAALQLSTWAQPQPAAASKLGAAADSAWEAIGGGPADLTFPDTWLGVWDVTSTLVDVQLPLGPEVLPAPNKAAVQRAQQEDLNKPLTYQVAFMRNAGGKVVYDRRFNTAALLANYYGSNVDFAGRISWDPQDPNALKLTLPEGIVVTSRVLRRSEQQLAQDRLETSEFMQQVFDDGSLGHQPRVKASQCYTKFKWRDEAAAQAAGGPAIVATQVVNDFLTPFDDSAAYMAAANKPITTYTYRMAFSRHHNVTQQVASVVHVS